VALVLALLAASCDRDPDTSLSLGGGDAFPLPPPAKMPEGQKSINFAVEDSLLFDSSMLLIKGHHLRVRECTITPADCLLSLINLL
jgi:hypothetical protein